MKKRRSRPDRQGIRITMTSTDSFRFATCSPGAHDGLGQVAQAFRDRNGSSIFKSVAKVNKY
jgi:hypothetical protein